MLLLLFHFFGKAMRLEMFARKGFPIFNLKLNIEQSGTRVGRYQKKIAKTWDVRYGRSLT